RVLLLGETGVGKEVLAREIHRSSRRAAGPFLAFNCAALPASLLEGELFGHERGAFTGAAQGKPGLLEAASGGTVLLDEVGELDEAAQVKLLRALAESEVLRLGGRAPRRIDVRFIAATHRDLEADAERGRFRPDLLYRLNTMTLTLPPLRDRPAEIEPLAASFLARACAALDRSPAPSLSAEARAMLRRHRWPGNVRELRNAMERAAVLCGGDEVRPEHLPARIASTEAGAAPPREAPPPAPGARTLLVEPPDERLGPEELERRRISDALDQCAGNQTRAAMMLGISRRTLLKKLDMYGLPRPRKPEGGTT
ncbi:MAG: sigma-54-dependent Fis family transcriptional regulator, partial [Polyangiaceae bacterium]|nr:sigma-54-dependent Fis family transcriptional regulator [Polyangiaceae bacterium]